MHPQCGGMGSLYLILYIDDVTFFGSSMEDIEALKTALSTHFEMTDMGKIQSYLGIRILRDHPNRHLEIDQSRYLRGVRVHALRTVRVAPEAACASTGLC